MFKARDKKIEKLEAAVKELYRHIKPFEYVETAVIVKTYDGKYLLPADSHIDLDGKHATIPCNSIKHVFNCGSYLIINTDCGQFCLKTPWIKIGPLEKLPDEVKNDTIS